MSRLNKVNPDHYTQAGRLTPDDLARERKRQGEAHPGGRRRRNKAMPPWMAAERGGAGAAGAAGASGTSGTSGAGDALRDAGAAGAEGEGPEGAESAESVTPRVAGNSTRVKTVARGAKRGGSATQTQRARGAAKGTGSDRGEVTARKGKRPAPRRKVTGAAVKTAKRTSTKASGASGTPKTRKAPKARASAARGGSKQRAGAPGMRKGRTKGSGVTRKKQKKNRS